MRPGATRSCLFFFEERKGAELNKDRIWKDVVGRDSRRQVGAFFVHRKAHASREGPGDEASEKPHSTVTETQGPRLTFSPCSALRPSSALPDTQGEAPGSWGGVQAPGTCVLSLDTAGGAADFPGSGQRTGRDGPAPPLRQFPPALPGGPPWSSALDLIPGTLHFLFSVPCILRT